MEMTDTSVDVRVKLYVAIRDKLRAMDAAHEERRQELVEEMNKIGGWLLAFLETSGGEAIRTKEGTVYQTVRTTASLADADAFMKFVVENEQFDLLDRRANATAVREYVESNNVLPPGVNLNSHAQVNVRRA
jgi:hypothetical protein